jgi:hypothetical protein
VQGGTSGGVPAALAGWLRLVGSAFKQPGHTSVAKKPVAMSPHMPQKK